MLYIIIPVFNAEKYLHECLDSVLGQTNSELSVICVNDGSTDGSLSILQKYQKKHPNLTVITTANCGPSHARNTALEFLFEKENGEEDWVSFVDADDFVAVDYFERMFAIQKLTNADIVCSSFCFYKDGFSHPFAGMKDSDKTVSSFEATLELVSDKTIQSHSPSKVYRVCLWEKVRYPEQIAAMEDQATIFKTFCAAKRVAIFPSINGYFYRQSGSSICSSSITNKRVLDSIEGYMIPCSHEYPGEWSRTDVVILKRSARQALAACYLMMYPRYRPSLATEDEKKRWKRISKYSRSVSLIKSYKPESHKEKIKKYGFLFCRPIYKLLYRKIVS